MKEYHSKTGYAKCLVDGIIYKADVIYLGIYDNSTNYIDVTKEEYNDYCKKQQEGV